MKHSASTLGKQHTCLKLPPAGSATPPRFPSITSRHDPQKIHLWRSGRRGGPPPGGERRRTVATTCTSASGGHLCRDSIVLPRRKSRGRLCQPEVREVLGFFVFWGLAGVLLLLSCERVCAVVRVRVSQFKYGVRVRRVILQCVSLMMGRTVKSWSLLGESLRITSTDPGPSASSLMQLNYHRPWCHVSLVIIQCFPCMPRNGCV